MKVIKLNAIDSTNSYLKQMVANSCVEDQLVVTTSHQQKGRGQRGASWQSEAGKSLACSLFKRFETLTIHDQFSLTMLVSLGILDAMQLLEIPKIEIKWPNDIMSHGKKMAGVLIENQIKGKVIHASIIGIGLNVNETSFDELPQATSMKLVTGRILIIDEVLQTVADSVFERLKKIHISSFETIRSEYQAHLFRNNKISVFETLQGFHKNGKIQGVSKQGKLVVIHDNDELAEYDLKEIKLLF